MGTAYLVASVAAIGTMLQGWHGGAISGALLYLTKDFELEDNKQIQGLIIASAFFTACMATLCAGPLADWLGRRKSLLVSGMLYTVGAAVMAWSPQVHVLIMGRFIVGAATGLASAISPLHISECSPPDIRGQLLTVPQLFISVGTLLAFSFAFGISLMLYPTWRTMLAITLVPSIIYVVLCSWYLPESPRWLASKGRLCEAKEVLQWLRKRDDVAAEIAVLTKGLGHSSVTLEEYLLHPANVESSHHEEGSHIQIIGADPEGGTWIAEPIHKSHDLDQNTSLSGTGSLRCKSNKSQNFNKLLPPDPLVVVMASFHSNATDGIHVSSSFDGFEPFPEFDEENPSPMNGYAIDDAEIEEDLLTPLLESRSECSFSGELTSPTCSTRSSNRSLTLPISYDHVPNEVRNTNNSFQHERNDIPKNSDIGGGWQLARLYLDEEDKSGDFRTVFLHQQSIPANASFQRGSVNSIDGGAGSRKALVLQASSQVGMPLQSQASLVDKEIVGPSVVHQTTTTCLGPAWSDIKEPGVTRALLVGCTLLFLQQFSGLNAVLYYFPQIVGASGTEGLVSSLSRESTSLLASMILGILMIPFLLWSMRLMDTSGRRSLLLKTIPFLPLCLILVIVIGHCVSQGVLQALLSFITLLSFICCFVMGLSPIPNVLCAEIFPTRVRGLCNGICAASMWFSTIVTTYVFPVAVSKIGLDGVLIFFAVMGIISWVYIYMKVPETKGMALEVITELFAIPTGPKESRVLRQNNALY
ncbi:hypothetical protein KP509_05G075500 [Ceratopteris richardii]|uniref:Major facilitator superfamily (MFS) profile domain-containing protein n=1 Tax=Ceratopteris richardii TaxID=49495 RepID=A0A8T2UZR6_CERRI|nr:hypothetical protein KP509_05G075500 [Ceratopteris richardii]